MAVKTATKSTAAGKRTASKKPVARKRVQTPAPFSTGRFLRETARVLLTVFAAAVLGVALFAGYRAATASEVFQTNRIDIEGARRASVPAIETIAERLTDKTGVWNADLDSIRREIERLTWVKTAIVSRVLPDGLRVRVIERKPIAVVRAESGKLVWVDEEAKMLGVVLQSEKAPPFALVGWNETESDAARKNNQERLSLYLKLLDEFQTAEIANRITAIDLSDLRETGALIQKDDSHVTVQIGREDFVERLKLALEVLDRMPGEQAREIEKIISHGSRLSIVPRKGAPVAERARNSANDKQKRESR
ncbi:MAG TPA: FtsQ-type POTRA domain-containing protein [Pyrinomonadaceae bacterium]|nr:FtsQ-type POTRA domain-containing protein [Pyrinomonadaceae bacterium]